MWRLEGENTLKALLTEKDKELKKVGELLSVEGGQAAAATIVRQVKALPAHSVRGCRLPHFQKSFL